MLHFGRVPNFYSQFLERPAETILWLAECFSVQVSDHVHSPLTFSNVFQNCLHKSKSFPPKSTSMLSGKTIYAQRKQRYSFSNLKSIVALSFNCVYIHYGCNSSSTPCVPPSYNRGYSFMALELFPLNLGSISFNLWRFSGSGALLDEL